MNDDTDPTWESTLPEDVDIDCSGAPPEPGSGSGGSGDVKATVHQLVPEGFVGVLVGTPGIDLQQIDSRQNNVGGQAPGDGLCRSVYSKIHPD